MIVALASFPAQPGSDVDLGLQNVDLGLQKLLFVYT